MDASMEEVVTIARELVAAAEKLQPYLAKGSKVALEGKLRYSSWESGGLRRSKLGVIVDDLEFMSSRRDDAGSGYAPRPVTEADPAIDAAASVYDEDIPF